MSDQISNGGGGSAAAGKAGRITYSSDIQATVVVNSTQSDTSLPDVVVPANPVPSGASIQKVYAAVSWRKSVESSSGANAVNVAQNIQVRDDSPSAWLDAIDIPDNSLAHAADGIEGGFMLVGDRDVSGTVDGADTYNFQWENSDVDGDSLTFYDWQCHLIIEYS